MAIKRKTTTKKGTAAQSIDAFAVKWALPTTYVLLVLIVVLAGIRFGLISLRQQQALDSSTLQSVTLTTGQTFFGQLEAVGSGTFALHNAYYIQQQAPVETPTTQDTDDTSDEAGDETVDIEPAEETTSAGLELVQVQNDLHLPEGTMYIRKEQVVYWQNLSDNSPIIQTILSNQ